MTILGPSNQTELLAKLQDGTITQEERKQLLSRNSGLISSNMESTATDFTKDTSIPTVGGITSPINEADLVAKLRNGTITQDEKNQLLALNGYTGNSNPSAVPVDGGGESKSYDGGTVTSGPEGKTGVGTTAANSAATAAGITGHGVPGMGMATAAVGSTLDGLSVNQTATNVGYGLVSDVANMMGPLGVGINAGVSLAKADNLAGAIPGVGLGIAGGLIGTAMAGPFGGLAGAWGGTQLGNALSTAFGWNDPAVKQVKESTPELDAEAEHDLANPDTNDTPQSDPNVGRTSEASAADGKGYGGLGATVGRTSPDTYSKDEGNVSAPTGPASVSNPGTLGDSAAASFGKDGTGSDSGGSASGSNAGAGDDGIGGDRV